MGFGMSRIWEMRIDRGISVRILQYQNDIAGAGIQPAKGAYIVPNGNKIQLTTLKCI